MEPGFKARRPVHGILQAWPCPGSGQRGGARPRVCHGAPTGPTWFGGPFTDLQPPVQGQEPGRPYSSHLSQGGRGCTRGAACEFEGDARMARVSLRSVRPSRLHEVEGGGAGHWEGSPGHTQDRKFWAASRGGPHLQLLVLPGAGRGEVLPPPEGWCSPPSTRAVLIRAGGGATAPAGRHRLGSGSRWPQPSQSFLWSEGGPEPHPTLHQRPGGAVENWWQDLSCGQLCPALALLPPPVPSFLTKAGAAATCHRHTTGALVPGPPAPPPCGSVLPILLPASQNPRSGSSL